MAEYIDRDKLRQAMFQEAFEKDSDLQRWDSGCWIRYKLFENVLEKTEVADVQPVKWIPVTERLPEYNLVVLVTDGEEVGTGYRYAFDETGFTGWAVPFADIEEDDVTHWMPLPKPPKDGET